MPVIDVRGTTLMRIIFMGLMVESAVSFKLLMVLAAFFSYPEPDTSFWVFELCVWYYYCNIKSELPV